MAGSTNFLQWDELQENMLSDVDYASSDMRVGGIKPNVRVAAPSNLHNKLYHQLAIMVAALARSLANRGYNVKDDDINTLVAVLDDILTRADADFDLYLHKNKVGEMLLRDVLVKDGVKIDGRDISVDGAKLDSLTGGIQMLDWPVRKIAWGGFAGWSDTSIAADVGGIRVKAAILLVELRIGHTENDGRRVVVVGKFRRRGASAVDGLPRVVAGIEGWSGENEDRYSIVTTMVIVNVDENDVFQTTLGLEAGPAPNSIDYRVDLIGYFV